MPSAVAENGNGKANLGFDALGDGPDQESEVKEPSAVKTHWKDIYIVSIFYFFAYVTYHALTIPLYSYLKQIDQDASIQFYGFITSAFKVGHCISIVYFAINTFVTRRYKNSLLIGRIVAIIGCVLYLFVEILPLRKYVVLLVFLLHSIAEGSLISIRSYVPRISTTQDRSAAHGFKNGSVLLAVVAAPIIQIVVSSIPWPQGGIVIIDPWFKLNAYTGVIWLILLFNIAALYIVVYHFREPFEMEGTEEDKPAPLMPSLRKAWNHLKTLDKRLIVMCMVERSVSGGGMAALITILNPYVSITFNTSNDQSLVIISVASVVVGLFSIGVVFFFIFANLGARIPSSRLFPLSLVILLVSFVLSYPFPLISDKVVVKSEGNPYGCDASVYEWCNTLYMMPKYLWITMSAILSGISMPFSLISQDTIYSRVLEGMDQNIMQAAYVMTEDVFLAATPTIATYCFEHWSPPGFFIGCAVLMIIGLFLWAPVYRKLRARGI